MTFLDLLAEKKTTVYALSIDSGVPKTTLTDIASGKADILARLQMQCYVCVSDFPYRLDKDGNTYGWGITEYTTPEELFREQFTKGLYRCKPEVSRKKIEAHLHHILPKATDDQIARFIGTN